MKKYLIVSLFCATVLFISRPTFAQDSGFGIGAMLNDPTGISMKGWVNEDFAIDGAVSFEVGRNFSQFYLHADAIQHTESGDEDFDLENGELRLYYGAGMRLIWIDTVDDLFLGIRGPVGINYTSDDAPIDAFFELVPTIDFSPRFRFSFAGALGLRIFLN
jgi:hypothetical protein